MGAGGRNDPVESRLGLGSDKKGRLERVRSRRQHSRERHLAIDGLLEDVLDGGADFRAVAIDDPTLLAFLKRAARHHFEQHPALRPRMVEDFGADRFRLAEVSQQP
jgi:hypothetical protein